MTRTAAESGADATESRPADRSEQAELLDRLGETMEMLDDRERLAIHLYYLEADPVGAAASALELSRSGYYKLLARARGRLTELMKERQPS